MKTKACTKCKEVKPFNEFCERSEKKDGRSSHCKVCVKAHYDAHKELMADKRRAWRKKKPPEYFVWQSMRARCSNPNNKYFSRYGGRGITICPEWDSFDQFFKDVGPRLTSVHQIDRIDNDGNYEPKNCRWSTPAENVHNSSACRLTWNEVELIRNYWESGDMMQRDIATRFNIAPCTVSSICAYRSWRTA